MYIMYNNINSLPLVLLIHSIADHRHFFTLLGCLLSGCHWRIQSIVLPPLNILNNTFNLFSITNVNCARLKQLTIHIYPILNKPSSTTKWFINTSRYIVFVLQRFLNSVMYMNSIHSSMNNNYITILYIYYVLN